MLQWDVEIIKPVGLGLVVGFCFPWLDIEIEHVRFSACAVQRPPCSTDGNQTSAPRSPAERAAQRTWE